MDNLRFVLFVFFLFLSYEIWQQWQIDYGPKPEANVSLQAPDLPAATPGAINAAPQNQPTGNSGSPTATLAGEGLSQGKRIRVTTDVLSLEIDTSGGDIRLLDLSQYPQNKDQPEPVVRLLNDQPPELFITQSGLLSDAGQTPTHHSQWQAEATEYRLAPDADTLRVPLTWADDKGIKVTKTYVFQKGSYLIAMEQRVTNQSGTVLKTGPYVQLERTRPEKKPGSAFSTSSADRAYVGGVLYTETDKYEKISFDDMQEQKLDRRGKNGWVAMIQHYFVAAWIPKSGEDDTFYTKDLGEERFIIGAVSPQQEIAPGSEQVFQSRLFAGPKLQRALESVAPGLELTVDFGNLTFIAKPIFWLLEKYHAIFANWGWAIIFVTITIKLLFYKLSESSYRSMANMRKLQPKLKELKERYGEDKQQFNMAMMELYRKEKVNPLGGCLPVLVQIPVFISLYWVLVEAVELRQAPFALWLQDLSAKDPYFVLPVIYSASMFFQQKLNPQPQDPIQAKVMLYMPLMFGFFFAFFPSGLVLYWVVNNLLSILQQWVITRQIDKHA